MQSDEFSALLEQCRNGDKQALDALTPVVYAELKKMAASFMRRERPGSTLQPTALIHEAYLRLAQQSLPDFQGRTHFFGVAAHIMRQVLIGNARRRHAQKRNGGIRVEMNDVAIPAQHSEDLLALDEVLDRLAEQDERKAKVIELKYFGGLTREEIAEALGLTVATVKHDLTVGEAWLRSRLGGPRVTR
jgi:RNA polymerase sigma-70 factor (ECF subfamily)